MIELTTEQFILMTIMPMLTLWFGFGFAVWAERHRLKKRHKT